MSRSGTMIAAVLLLAASLPFASLPVAAQQSSTPTTITPKDIESVVREYLLKNPEIIVEALETYKRRAEEAQRDAVRQTIDRRKDSIQNDPDSPVGGNPDGDVTIVEFFDYRCGVCKRVHGTVAELIKSDSSIRRVYKEWPILGPESVFASRAALASRAQGKYLAFHDALMEHRGALTPEQIMRIAGSIGIDTKRLRTDMKAARIDAIIRKNYELAEALNINGTPSFIIGNQLVPGAADLDSLKSLVRKARRKE